jgi:DNA invertase Pin-like site-specific DNA recombinase
LEYVLEALEAGDVLVVMKLDRLARSTPRPLADH